MFLYLHFSSLSLYNRIILFLHICIAVANILQIQHQDFAYIRTSCSTINHISLYMHKIFYTDVFCTSLCKISIDCLINMCSVIHSINAKHRNIHMRILHCCIFPVNQPDVSFFRILSQTWKLSGNRRQYGVSTFCPQYCSTYDFSENTFLFAPQ